MIEKIIVLLVGITVVFVSHDLTLRLSPNITTIDMIRGFIMTIIIVSLYFALFIWSSNSSKQEEQG